MDSKDTLKQLCDGVAKELIAGTYSGVPETDAAQISGLLKQELEKFLGRCDVKRIDVGTF